MAPLYGLTRGPEWVTCPAERRKLAALPPGSPLLSRAGEAAWLPRTRMGSIDQAWTTPRLETAIARQDLLRILAPGLVTVVRALPHE